MKTEQFIISIVKTVINIINITYYLTNRTLDAIITIVTDNKLPSLSDSVLGSNSNFPAPSEPRIPRNTPRLPNSRSQFEMLNRFLFSNKLIKKGTQEDLV